MDKIISEKEYNKRYYSQLILKGFGKNGQSRLLAAKVLVIGAGGLGCPVLQILTAAGVGKVGIVDYDVVNIRNLSRQILYSDQDVGKLKVDVARLALTILNPHTEIALYPVRLTNQNALEIINQYDIVVDGTDNFSSRYIINDASVLLNKPLVFGAISEYEGQISSFNVFEPERNSRSVHYRDAFPEKPMGENVVNCAILGVLGVLTGIIGSMMASETIKLVVGIGKPLLNKIWNFNALSHESYIFQIKPQLEHPKMPKSVEAFQKMEY